MQHGKIYNQLSTEELKKRPKHLQHAYRFQDNWSEFYFIGLLSNHPDEWISEDYKYMSKCLNQKDPDFTNKNVIWTYNGPMDVTDKLNDFGEILEVHCGMHFTALVIRKLRPTSVNVSIEINDGVNKSKDSNDTKDSKKKQEADEKKKNKKVKSKSKKKSSDQSSSSDSDSDTSSSSDHSSNSSKSSKSFKSSKNSKSTKSSNTVKKKSGSSSSSSSSSSSEEEEFSKLKKSKLNSLREDDIYLGLSTNTPPVVTPIVSSHLNAENVKLGLPPLSPRIVSDRQGNDLNPSESNPIIQLTRSSPLLKRKSSSALLQNQKQVKIRKSKWMKNVVILTTRKDILGEDLEFEDIDAISVGKFHIVVRRGHNLWSIGLNQYGQCGVPILEENDQKPSFLPPITNWTEIPVKFRDDFGAFQFPDPGSMKKYMKRNASTNSLRLNRSPRSPRSQSQGASPQSSIDALQRASISPRSPISPLTHYYQSRSDGDLSRGGSLTNIFSTLKLPEIAFIDNEEEGEFDEEDELQTMTIENAKKRDSLLHYKFERIDILKTRTQPSNVNVDKNLSHMKQINDLLSIYIQKLSSYSIEQKLEGASSVRKILARDENHLISVTKFVESAGIESCIRFLDHPEEQLQIEIIWILIRTATTENQEFSERIFDEYNVQKLIAILENSENDLLLELVVQLFGNLCAHESNSVDQRIILPRVMQVMSYSPPLELRRICAWAMTNIIRNMPYEDAKLALPTFSYIIEDYEIEDKEILREAIRGMYYLSWSQLTHQIHLEFREDIEEYVTQCIISLFLNEDARIVQDCIKTIGNIISSPINVHSKKCIDGNLLPTLGEILDRFIQGEEEVYPGMMIDICWIISNLSCSTSMDVDLILENDLLGKIKMLSFQIENDKVQKEIAYIFGNITTSSRPHQLKLINEYEPMEHLTQFIKSNDDNLVLLILDAFFEQMESGMILTDSLVETIREISERHNSQNVYKRGQSIVNTHTRMKKLGGQLATKRLQKLPPKPLSIETPEVYCTYCATFIVFGRGQQVWGCGRASCLGLDTKSESIKDEFIKIPVQIDISMIDSPIKQISGGFEHTILLTETGTIYAAGSNRLGCCGGTRWNSFNSIFTKVTMPDPNMCIEQISCGAYHTVFLSVFNTVFVCGKGEFGTLGLGHFNDQRVITQLRGYSEVKSIFTGFNTTGLVHMNETISSCGCNEWGMLGLKPQFEGELSLFNSTTYTRMQKMNLPPINDSRFLLEHKQHVGGLHMIIERQYEYIFEDRLLMSKNEEIFTDLVVSLKREDSNTTTLTIGDQEIEVPNQYYFQLISKDETLHNRLKFLSSLVGVDFLTGCLPPENEAEESFMNPLPGLCFWDNKKVSNICHWILEHFPELQFKFDQVRKELGEAASSWRRRQGYGI